MDTAEAWALFCSENPPHKQPYSYTKPISKAMDQVPEPGPLYISTRTKIAFLTSTVVLENAFWSIPITSHSIPSEGVIKKQMKFNSTSPEQLKSLQENLPTDTHVVEHVIKHIDSVEGRIGYTDVRKVSIGVCNKDITSYRCKKRGAFYNCFSVILRVHVDGVFKEMHIKVFNTGKLEVPGVQSMAVFNRTLDLLCDIMNRASPASPISWSPEKTQTVLINSNFTVGFLIDRERLHARLHTHYKINSNYDACSYPGIQCKFYFRPGAKVQTGQQPEEDEPDTVKMSFMVFRTGSVLIVGRCTEDILRSIYSCLCDILEAEYPYINKGVTSPVKKQPKKKQPRLKTLVIPAP